jgi:hypothetical protein
MTWAKRTRKRRKGRRTPLRRDRARRGRDPQGSLGATDRFAQWARIDVSQALSSILKAYLPRHRLLTAKFVSGHARRLWRQTGPERPLRRGYAHVRQSPRAV